MQSCRYIYTCIYMHLKYFHLSDVVTFHIIENYLRIFLILHSVVLSCVINAIVIDSFIAIKILILLEGALCQTTNTKKKKPTTLHVSDVNRSCQIGFLRQFFKGGNIGKAQ